MTMPYKSLMLLALLAACGGLDKMTRPAEKTSKNPTIMASEGSGGSTTTTNVYCPALASACFALKITMTPPATPGFTKYDISIQNLQGSYGAGTVPFGITGFRVDRVNYTPGAVKPTDTILVGGLVGGAYPQLSGQVGINKNGGGGLTDNSCIPVEADEMTCHHDYWDLSMFGLVGCALPPATAPDDFYLGVYFFRTCPKVGLNGWVTFTFPLETLQADPLGIGIFPLPGPTTLGYANFAIETVSGNGAYAVCTFLPAGGNTCPVFPYPRPK